MSATSLPEQSCFLILEPTEQNLGMLSPCLQKAAKTRFASLDRAANVARVPRYFSTSSTRYDLSSWLSTPCERTRKRIFDCPETESPWHNDDLVTAIKSENRERLFICGFWLDIDLGPTAIEAYADGFDVHVLSDLVFSRLADDHCDALSRLTQMGIVPITTTQLVHEWMSWTPEPEKASELKSILDNIVE